MNMKYHSCHVNILLLNLLCLNSILFSNFSTPCFSVYVLNGLYIRHMDGFQKGRFVTVGISDRLPPHTEACFVCNPCQNKTREISLTNYYWHTKYVLFILFFEYLTLRRLMSYIYIWSTHS